MKRWIALILCLAAVVSISGCGTEVNGDNSEITDFTLETGESAFTTCWGSGITISGGKLKDNDIDLTFAVNGSVVNLKISLLTMTDYLSENYDYTLKSETVTGAGYKTVSFSNLDSGTYVLMWEQMGTSQVQITGAELAAASVAEAGYTPSNGELKVGITMSETGEADISAVVDSAYSPLSLVQELSISKLLLQTDEGESTLDGQYAEKMQIENGSGSMTILIDEFPETEYHLIITELTGYAKAECPLPISGNWSS